MFSVVPICGQIPGEELVSKYLLNHISHPVVCFLQCTFFLLYWLLLQPISFPEVRLHLG